MSFWQRLRFFLIGFIPGCIILAYVIQYKGCSSPNELKMQELVNQHFELSEVAKCQLKCLRLSELGLKIELRKFEVNYDLTDVHKKPCGLYYVQPKSNEIAKFKLVIQDCDTTSKILNLELLNSNCKCQ